MFQQKQIFVVHSIQNSFFLSLLTLESTGANKLKPESKNPMKRISRSGADLVGTSYPWGLNSSSNTWFKKHNIYRPPTKFQKGNVFSRVSVCPSTSGGVQCDHYPWCLLPHHTWTVPDPAPAPSCTGTSPRSQSHSPVSYIWWPRLEICSNLFTWVPLSPPGADIWWLATAARMVGEQAVRILFECLLVLTTFCSDLETSSSDFIPLGAYFHEEKYAIIPWQNHKTNNWKRQVCVCFRLPLEPS